MVPLPPTRFRAPALPIAEMQPPIAIQFAIYRCEANASQILTKPVSVPPPLSWVLAMAGSLQLREHLGSRSKTRTGNVVDRRTPLVDSASAKTDERIRQTHCDAPIYVDFHANVRFGHQLLGLERFRGIDGRSPARRQKACKRRSAGKD